MPVIRIGQHNGRNVAMVGLDRDDFQSLERGGIVWYRIGESRCAIVRAPSDMTAPAAVPGAEHVTMLTRQMMRRIEYRYTAMRVAWAKVGDLIVHGGIDSRAASAVWNTQQKLTSMSSGDGHETKKASEDGSTS